MKKSKIYFVLLIITLVALVINLTITGTLAWLTASTKTVVTTFTMGSIEMDFFESELDENGVPVDPKVRVLKNEHKVIPGGKVFKDPTVAIEVNSEPCYVYIAVKDGISAVAEGGVFFTPDNSKVWIEIKDDGLALKGIKLYRYTDSAYDVSTVRGKTYSKGTPEKTYKEITPSLFSEVNFDGEKITEDNIGNFDKAKILVAAYAHQSANTTMEAADKAAVTHFSGYIW